MGSDKWAVMTVVTYNTNGVNLLHDQTNIEWPTLVKVYAFWLGAEFLHVHFTANTVDHEIFVINFSSMTFSDEN